MSCMSKAPSKYTESIEESSWTKYFEDFFDNNNIDHDDHKVDDSSSSLVSEASKKLLDHHSAQARLVMSFKKRKKIKTTLHHDDDDLEDTASSPINSPKVLYKAQEKEELTLQEKGNTNQGERDERKELGFNEMDSDHTELKKRGLCLVPLSTVMSYLG